MVAMVTTFFAFVVSRFAKQNRFSYIWLTTMIFNRVMEASGMLAPLSICIYKESRSS